MDFDRVLYFLFGIPCAMMELVISLRKYSTGGQSESKDRGTFLAIWIMIIGSQIFSLHYTRLGYGTKMIENKSIKYFLWVPLSLTLYTIGILLRKQSIEQLGQWFTTVVRTNENQPLIDIGWYARMRHPSYTGLLLYFLALAFFLNNWLSLFGIMIPITLSFLYRIHVEEEELHRHFGVKYEQYKQKVPNRIIPKIF